MIFKAAAIASILAASSAQERQSLRTLSQSSAPSVCDKYTAIVFNGEVTAANELQLVTLVVNRAVLGSSADGVPGIFTPGDFTIGSTTETVNLLKYFDGSLYVTNVGGKREQVNFLDGDVNQNTLLTHLYQYFGALLGCSASGFPAYEGDNSMYEVHKFMNINPYEMGYFVKQVGLSALSFGVSQAEVEAIATALMNLFGFNCLPSTSIAGGLPALQSVCVALDCPLAQTSECSFYSPQASNAGNLISSLLGINLGLGTDIKLNLLGLLSTQLGLGLNANANVGGGGLLGGKGLLGGLLGMGGGNGNNGNNGPLGGLLGGNSLIGGLLGGGNSQSSGLIGGLLGGGNSQSSSRSPSTTVNANVGTTVGLTTTTGSGNTNVNANVGSNVGVGAKVGDAASLGTNVASSVGLSTNVGKNGNVGVNTNVGSNVGLGLGLNGNQAAAANVGLGLNLGAQLKPNN